MSNIILQSQKDAKKMSERPTIIDTLTWKGFLRYFAYRNTLPFTREIIYLVINLIEFFLILYLFGKSVGIGSAIAIVFLFFKNNMWKAFLYSLRDKILELKMSERLSDLPKLFYSYAFLAILYWSINVTLGYVLINISSPMGRIIFINKLAAGIFTLISSTYFFSAYTLSRVYISMYYNIANRVLNLVLVIFLYKFIGIYAFILSFYLVGLIDLFITFKYCRRIFLKFEINFKIGYKKIISSIGVVAKKTKENYYESTKKFSTFFLIYFQPLLLIYLVNIYYEDYLIEYFIFSSFINLLFIFPNRISQSMYYDSTLLIFNNNFNMLKNIFYKNLTILMLIAICCVASLIGVTEYVELPRKWSLLLLDLKMIDKWYWLYLFILFSFPIKLFSYIFMVSESYKFLTLLTLTFDYLLVAILFLSSDLSDNILYIFFVRGQISPYYLVALILIFISGIWKKDSKLAQMLKAFSKESSFISMEKFIQETDHLSHLDPVVCILILDRKYSRKTIIEHIGTEIKNSFNIKAISRVSNNTILVLNTPDISNLKRLDIDYKAKIGVFCSFIEVDNLSSLPEKLTRTKGHAGFDIPNFIMNLVYPKLKVSKNDIIHDIDNEQIDFLLNKSKIEYKKIKITKVGNFIEAEATATNRAKAINELCLRISRNEGLFPDNLVLRNDFVGLLPIISHGELLLIYELKEIDINLIKKVLRSILFKNLRGLCGGYWM